MTAPYHPAEIATPSGPSVPEGKRMPFNLAAAGLAPAEAVGLVLHWPSLPEAGSDVILRVTVAVDDREEKRVAVTLAESGERVADLDVRYADMLQFFEARIPAARRGEMRRQGLRLRLEKGTSGLWLIGSDPQKRAGFEPLLPLLRVDAAQPGEHAESAAGALCSLASAQQFGWKEGCVLDGIQSLDTAGFPGAEEALQAHLGLYFQGPRLVYENHVSAPADNTIYGIEGTLPFAILARLDAAHPSIDLALEFWNSRRSATGTVQDFYELSCEGAYTIAYPMAVIGRVRKLGALQDAALEQIALRHAKLFTGAAFHLRHYADGRRTFTNWARGACWLTLGTVRTLLEFAAPERPPTLLDNLRCMFDVLLKAQNEAGLWPCFLDAQELEPDTSASAGIAAAMAIAYQSGLLVPDPNLGDAAVRAWKGLQPYFSQDGFLRGVAQSNKGGEALQRSDYRVYSQMGLGLTGQLLGSLRTLGLA